MKTLIVLLALLWLQTEHVPIERHQKAADILLVALAVAVVTDGLDYVLKFRGKRQ